MGRNESPEEDVVAALPSMKDVYNRLREARSTVDSLEKAMGKAAQAALGRIKQLQEELAEARSSEKDDIERMRKKHEREVKDARVDAAALMKRLAEVRRETEAELEAENDRHQRMARTLTARRRRREATIDRGVARVASGNQKMMPALLPTSKPRISRNRLSGRSELAQRPRKAAVPVAARAVPRRRAFWRGRHGKQAPHLRARGVLRRARRLAKARAASPTSACLTSWESAPRVIIAQACIWQRRLESVW
eukprot:TRINITY_DN17211_c0_g1_i2.p1 TRINITY_DN17211_c0_g1~~TRINITY_DN17211_c0_g1_i2.p1  ORF type:complete len:251 (+),score=55.46 TRINITY_DN17211_c0_g1_i2:79-831(+)